MFAALALVGLAVLGPDLSISLPRAATAEPPFPGVRARASSVVVRSTPATPVGELAFLAVEPATGNLVVTDRGRKVILRFDPAGRRLSEWGPQLGSPQATLAEPAGVAVAADGSYWVVDRGQPRVFHVDATGRSVGIFDLQSFGTYGLNGVAIDREQRVLVADTGRNRILVLSPEGRLVREVGRAGKDLGQFTQPMQLDFSPFDGSLLVTDWENARVQRWAPDLSTATDAWGTSYRSYAITADARGRVYVADGPRRLVQAFAPRTGALLGELGAPGGVAIEVPGLVQLAVGPAVGPTTPLYTLGPQAIARVELEDTPPPPQATSGLLPSLADVLDPSTLAFLAAAAIVGALLLDRRRRRAQPASAS